MRYVFRPVRKRLLRDRIRRRNLQLRNQTSGVWTKRNYRIRVTGRLESHQHRAKPYDCCGEEDGFQAIQPLGLAASWRNFCLCLHGAPSSIESRNAVLPPDAPLYVSPHRGPQRSCPTQNFRFSYKRAIFGPIRSGVLLRRSMLWNVSAYLCLVCRILTARCTQAPTAKIGLRQ